MPFPTPLLPCALLAASAGELRDVDNRTVIAGGTVTANLPQFLRNSLRSSWVGGNSIRDSPSVSRPHSVS